VESFDQYVTAIRAALNEEQKALSALPRTALLTNGVRVTSKPNRAFYRFEIPDNFYIVPGMNVQGSIGSLVRFSFAAVVADVQSQFVYFLFPCDMGEVLPELHCTWNPAELAVTLSGRWSALQPTIIVKKLLTRTFTDNILPAAKEPIFPSSFTPAQRTAVKQSIGRRISVVIGERRRGKTSVAAALVFNALREGKRVLYLASSSRGLYDCVREMLALNPVVVEESVVPADAGLDLQPQLEVDHLTVEGTVDTRDAGGLKKLFSIILAEHEYLRAQSLQKKIIEKQQQVEKADAEAKTAKDELHYLQNASMIERMKQRINKETIDNAQMKLRNKLALVERLNQQVAVLTKEMVKRESSLPVPPKEQREIVKLASVTIPLTGEESFVSAIASKNCLATTVYQALHYSTATLSNFDVVCIDDAHALNLAEFFYCVSLAKERCYLFAAAAEQSPQSVSQIDTARRWLQKNYFSFFQQDDGDRRRFTSSIFPEDVVSELDAPEAAPTMFAASLHRALDNSPLPQGAKGKIYFINTEDQHATSLQYIGKKKILPFNEANAKRATECVKHALLNGATTQSDIMIVTPPSGQTLHLREHLKAHQLSSVEIASLGSLRLCIKRAVIFDLTVAGIDFTLRSLDDKKTGTVKIADTLNTLLSTVSDDLYVVADMSHFRTRYKGRLITTLLETMLGVSENSAAVVTAVRRFDDLSTDLRRKVIFGTAEEKQSREYLSMLQQTRSSTLDAAKSAPQQTVALADKKLKADIRTATLRVLAKRELINTIAQYLEASLLYRSTTETQKFAALLPEHECETENDFKDMMEMWNLLIYETSDTLKPEHPLAVKAKVDAKISSDLRQIHTYYHSDLEMVVEEGKHRLAQSIQKVFNDCIGKKPVTPADWKNAYLIFLNRLGKYLDTVVNQIRL